MTEESASLIAVNDGGPVVAVAVHNGHAVRDEVEALLAVDGATRFHDEDPYTGGWTEIADTRVVVYKSRFEVDLNRPRDRAVYLNSDEAWGLTVWKQRPPQDLIERTLRFYDEFYAKLGEMLAGKVREHGRFVVYDLHTYSHRRGGPAAEPEPQEENPDVNLGTGTLDRRLWGAVADSFMADMRGFDFPGRRLDVRENVKFRGGYLSQWVNNNFPGQGCALAIEVKKFFMDEWSGELYHEQYAALKKALAATLPNVLEILGKM